MISKPLASIAKIVAGQSPKSSTYNSTSEGLPFFQGKADFQEMYPTVRMWCTSEKRKEAESGDILISMRAPVGAVNICNQKSIIGRGLAAIRPSSQLDGRFLYYWLKANERQIDALGTGSTFKAITQDTLKKIEVPVPPLDDQIRIVHLLGKVEGLIVQRKQHLQQLDDLIKSVFLEMFGDPVRNEKRWETGSLTSYGTFKNGLNFGRGESGTTVRYLGVGDFKSKAKLDDIDGLAFIELKEPPTADYFLQDGDLLFVRSNGNRELVGRCMAVYPREEKVTYSGFCIRYRINDPALQATYITHLFRSSAFRRVLFQGGQGANIQNINQKTLSGLPIPIPAKELQSRFATTVERVESLKSRYQKSLTDLESLYGALSQQAFNGELNLSRVPLPETKKVVIDLPQISASSDQTLKTSKRIINQLNDFNDKHSTILKAFKESSVLAALDTPALKAAREMAEQASLWRTPLDELKNMSAVARATEAFAASSGVQQLAQEMASINETTRLARQIANSLPKVDMGWLKEQQAMIEAATMSFTEMQQAMAALTLPEDTMRSFRESDKVMQSLQAALPNTSDLIPHFPATTFSISTEDEDEPRYIFTRHDILQVLSEGEPLSINSLMDKLTELEVITQQGYERIKTLVFELLIEGEIEQHYNNEENAIALKALA